MCTNKGKVSGARNIKHTQSVANCYRNSWKLCRCFVKLSSKLLIEAEAKKESLDTNDYSYSRS